MNGGEDHTILFDKEKDPVRPKPSLRNTSLKSKPDASVIMNALPANGKGGQQVKTEGGPGPKLEQEYWWDVARVTSRDFEIEQMKFRSKAETFKIIFKLLAYIFFFVIVLTSSVVSKLSLFTMVNAFKNKTQVSSVHSRQPQ